MTASLNCQKPAQWRYAIGTPNKYLELTALRAAANAGRS